MSRNAKPDHPGGKSAANRAPADARGTAMDILDAVLHHKRPLEDALEGSRGLARLDARDRNFARLLVATTLRRLGQIDQLIDSLLDRPERMGSRVVRHGLRLGIAQLLFLDTPPHAAVDSTVSLVGTRGHKGLRALANAIMRRIAGDIEGMRASLAPVSANCPDWMWRDWVASYGEATATRIADALTREPPLDITLNPGAGDPERWAEALEARRLPTGTLRRTGGGTITDLPGYDEGHWWIQDAAAALAAPLLAPGPGRTVIDLCAAPGGKTAQLAATGANVIAVDRSAKRVERMTRNLARLGLHPATVIADAATWRPPEPADAVLIDAPCSATGTIRRHPDILHAKQASDRDSLAGVQSRLLDAAAEMVRPGGTIVYSTCSLQTMEGEDRIEPFLREHQDFALSPIDADEIGGLTECLTERKTIRTLPCHLSDQGGLDGFFIARLIRRET